MKKETSEGAVVSRRQEKRARAEHYRDGGTVKESLATTPEGNAKFRRINVLEEEASGWREPETPVYRPREGAVEC